MTSSSPPLTFGNTLDSRRKRDILPVQTYTSPSLLLGSGRRRGEDQGSAYATAGSVVCASSS